MEFFFAIFSLLFYYLRPQDWVPGLAGANLVKPIIAAWILVLLMQFVQFAKAFHRYPLPAYGRPPANNRLRVNSCTTYAKNGPRGDRRGARLHVGCHPSGRFARFSPLAV